jgi:putative hydroxymethylpyrimidine transport system substrate-binding protein
MTRLAVIAVSLSLAVALGACGEKEEPGSGSAVAAPEQLTVMLDYFPNADHAGLYAAEASGEYERAGLDVTLVAPPDAAVPLKLLQAGRVDVAISYEPELLLARDKGADLVAVGALVQKPLTSVMALGDRKIRSVRDLKGKTVGTSGIAYQSAYLETILREAKVDPATVKEVNVGFNLVPAMLSKRVDATLGAFWNYEGVDLERRGRKPTILRMEALGVPTYAELVFVVRRRDLDSRGATKLRRFLQSVARGHAALRENPAPGIDALMEAGDGLERGLQEAAVEATLPVFFPSQADRPFGLQDPAEWDAYGKWMKANGLLENEPNAGRAITNEFLPGQGLDAGTAGLE